MEIIRDLSSRIIGVLKLSKKITLKSLSEILDIEYQNIVQSISILEKKNIVVKNRENKKLYISLNSKINIFD